MADVKIISSLSPPVNRCCCWWWCSSLVGVGFDQNPTKKKKEKKKGPFSVPFLPLCNVNLCFSSHRRASPSEQKAVFFFLSFFCVWQLDVLECIAISRWYWVWKNPPLFSRSAQVQPAVRSLGLLYSLWIRGVDYGYMCMIHEHTAVFSITGPTARHSFFFLFLSLSLSFFFFFFFFFFPLLSSDSSSSLGRVLLLSLFFFFFFFFYRLEARVPLRWTGRGDENRFFAVLLRIIVAPFFLWELYIEIDSVEEVGWGKRLSRNPGNEESWSSSPRRHFTLPVKIFHNKSLNHSTVDAHTVVGMIWPAFYKDINICAFCNICALSEKINPSIELYLYKVISQNAIQSALQKHGMLRKRV